MWTEIKPDNKETFLYMCDHQLLKFQLKILRPWLEIECLIPGFFFILLLSITIRESWQIYLSKLIERRKYVTLLIYYDFLCIMYYSLLMYYDLLCIMYYSLLMYYDFLCIMYYSLLMYYNLLCIYYDSYDFIIKTLSLIFLW